MLYKLKSFYYNVRNWFKTCCNKNHLKTVWHAFTAQPWDYGYTYDLLKLRLIEQREYFVKSNIIVQESIDEIVRKIDLALSLYDIMMGEKTAGHFDIKTPEERLKEPFSSHLKYVTTKYVNTRNVDRFFSNDIAKEYAKKYPNHLYEEKAKRLFWRIMDECSQNWWD